MAAQNSDHSGEMLQTGGRSHGQRAVTAGKSEGQSIDLKSIFHPEGKARCVMGNEAAGGRHRHSKPKLREEMLLGHLLRVINPEQQHLGPQNSKLR